jgi:hypothetical protein
LITARDMALPQARAAPVPAAGFRERLLLTVLYITVLASSVAFVEPSPHDFLMGLLALACLIAGVPFDRRLVLLFLLLVIFNAGGLLSLINVVGQDLTVQYTATSIYLAVAALVFACLFADKPMPRLLVLRSAYVLTAVLASLAAIAGYFHAFPGAVDLFASSGRGQGAFKDPNVYGPFLIWPILILLERMIVRRVGLIDLVTMGILAAGLLVSFSRGAWFHCAVSAAVVIALSFITAPSLRVRLRILILAAIGIAALAVLVAAMLSVDSVADMFANRFHLFNSYDVGHGGRFRLQELAFGAMLQFPNGMGPFGFARTHGLQQHNVYLQAFMVYGWIGGVTYIVLLGATFALAFRTVLIRTPWQPFLITAFAAFVGEVLEGMVIDTDHWRHFFLLLGMIWGLAAATLKYNHRPLRPGRVSVAAA